MKLTSLISKDKLRLIVTPIVLILAISVFPQLNENSQFNISNSESITSLVSYTKDINGYWIKRPPHAVNNLDGNLSLIGKNNKTKTIYVKDEFGVYAIILDKNKYSSYKKDKSIVSINDKEWPSIFEDLSGKISIYIEELNTTRENFINDSIAEVKRLEKIRLEEEARREAARQDSIRKVEFAKQQAIDDENYRQHSTYRRLNIENYIPSITDKHDNLRCIISDCDYIKRDSIIYPIALSGDTLAYRDYEFGPLDIIYETGHAIVMNDRFKSSKGIDQYLRVWGDSIRLKNGSIEDIVNKMTLSGLNEFFDELNKKAPNGYIKDWSWDNEYGQVSFNVSYLNTNKKTIKYIKFFFTVYNAVNDVRGSGSVQGTGPLDQFESARWEFDRTGCWPAGDASTMSITKIIITYMNGSTVTLTGKKIKFE